MASGFAELWTLNFKNKNIAKTENLKLTKEQQKAMNKIEGAINDKNFKEFLIISYFRFQVN